MTFEDLPDDWPTRSLADPSLAADVLDLVVCDADRSTGGVALLLCDGDGRLLAPVVMTLDHATGPADKALTVRRFCGALVEHARDGGLVLATVRECEPFVTDDDRAWHEHALRGCRDAGVSLLGCFLVTRHVVRELVLPADRTVRA